jgi:hypothetical protein
MVRTVAAIVFVVLATAHADADVAADKPSIWIESDVQVGLIVPRSDRWVVMGLGLDVRVRVIADLHASIGVAGLRVEPGYDPDKIGMTDERKGGAIQATLAVDYAFSLHRWERMTMALGPELGVAALQLRGIDPDPDRIRAAFVGVRLALDVASEQPAPSAAGALVVARSYGGHLAARMFNAGGDETSWTVVVGYAWGR